MTNDALNNDFDPAAYWERRLSSRFHLGGVGYISLGRRYNGWIYRVRERIVSRSITRRFGQARDLRVLDIGSGTGFYLRLWRTLGFDNVTGSDLTATSVDALQQRFPDLTVTRFDAGGEILPFDKASFDVISAMDVLPHVVDNERYRRAVANCAQLLGSGGTLLITDYLSPREHRDEHEVVRTRDDVLNALDAGGFDVVETTPLFVVMNNPICARPIYSKLWRLLMAPAHLHESVGWTLGAVLYPIERLLTAIVSNGPSAKLIMCTRRVDAPADHARAGDSPGHDPADRHPPVDIGQP